MVGKQLNGHGIYQGRNEWMDGRHFDGGEAAFACFGNPFGIGDQHNLAAPRHDFLHVANGFFEQRSTWRENDDGHRLVD